MTVGNIMSKSWRKEFRKLPLEDAVLFLFSSFAGSKGELTLRTEQSGQKNNSINELNQDRNRQ